jgi:hypothetical protein
VFRDRQGGDPVHAVSGAFEVADRGVIAEVRGEIAVRPRLAGSEVAALRGSERRERAERGFAGAAWHAGKFNIVECLWKSKAIRDNSIIGKAAAACNFRGGLRARAGYLSLYRAGGSSAA